ncbi:MAG: hypothetical protein OQJ98_00550 [Candidatus Pacebacteria bacterium]|nr:hypothetical protein [Candidatus Paceibacterota bacterium]
MKTPLQRAEKLLAKSKRAIGAAWRIIEEAKLALKKSDRGKRTIENKPAQ